MADRDRSKDRPGQGPLSFLPTIFGKRQPRASSHDKTRDEASPTSPISPSVPVTPFHLPTAISLMQPGETTEIPALCEIVKATAVWLANTLYSGGEVSESITSDEIKALYSRAIDFANPNSDYALRTAAVRLLAALLAISPPSQHVLEGNVSPVSVYNLIIAQTGGVGSARIDQMFVETGAMKALTKNGTELEGMKGIVGWCMKSLAKIQVEWVAWCATQEEEHDVPNQPFAQIKSATAGEALLALVDLLTCIITNHAAVFTSTDMNAIVDPILDMYWAGMKPEPQVNQSVDLRKSISQSSYPASPRSIPMSVTSNRNAKWAVIMPPLSAFLKTIITDTFIDSVLFDRSLVFMCFAFGQEEFDLRQDGAVYDLLKYMPKCRGGRQGEQAVRRILENENDHRVVRGAVIASQFLIKTASTDDLKSIPFISLVPSLIKAQSTSRPNARDWQNVDLEILSLLQEHLKTEASDAWTEGEAACDLLRGMVTVKDPSIAIKVKEILRDLPNTIGRSHSSTSEAAPFYHPRNVELLLTLAKVLGEDEAKIVIDFYEKEYLCLPFTDGWIKNTSNLLDAYYGNLPIARQRVSTLLFHTLYTYTEELPEHRAELVAQVIVPFLERHLLDETDPDFIKDALAVLVSAAVVETTEKDEERRRVRAEMASTEIDEEDAAAQPTPQAQAAASGGSFDSIRQVIIKLATLTGCSKLGTHMDCRSLHAVAALIAIFTRLSFAPTHSVRSQAGRMPASSRCITIYRDLLNLLYSSGTGTITARCPRARLAVLQWLTRLRADRKHRIFVRADIDGWIAPFAANLFRTKEAEDTIRQEDEVRRKKLPIKEDERGRSRISDNTLRSRSRSKHAPIIRTADPPQPYNPLWSIPDSIPFEVPPDTLPSEGMTTYDPHHPLLKLENGPPVEGVWLPVSEYVRVLNGILRYEQDWELVSYVLTFLPLQLGNKHFFHGKRATAEVKALLYVLCDGVLSKENRWERRFHLPSFIKRIQVNAAAYQALSILISYRGIFSREDKDLLIEALLAGLEGNATLAKPCVQALTVAVYELENSVSKHYVAIISKMQQILSTPAVAVHILEFLLALGQIPALYGNFTDDHYRLVFTVALNYIQEHNARSDLPVEFSDPETTEAYTLSQHVIGLAYDSIYTWFMAVKLPQRPSLVTELTQGLLRGKSKKVTVDERAEVCFDWLARYTYGNADPKPATSFLSEMVMSDNVDPPKSQSWLLGGAIVTVTAHARSGWATITTTRPTGSTSVVCKLENVPLLELGEANADMVSLPAFLMANRRPRDDEKGEDDPREIVKASSAPGESPEFDFNSQHGFIWSGATPSQRRKDVVVDPSYLALQLVSSYPNASLEVPRNRLIPDTPENKRRLRGISGIPVIDAIKIAVLYVGPDQKTETEILGNIDGSALYLDFVSGLGRLVRLKGQIDVYVGGLDREEDMDGEYAYAWWDDLSQVVYHAPTMMPNVPNDPNHTRKKSLVGNDSIKIVYNDSGLPYEFETIRSAFQFVNIVITPHATADGHGFGPTYTSEDWQSGDEEDFFKVTLQRCPGMPDFSAIGEHKLISRRTLPIIVRQIARQANDMASGFLHIRNAKDNEDPMNAEYITPWRARLKAIGRLRDALPPIELPNDEQKRAEMLRDFTRSFSQPKVTQ